MLIPSALMQSMASFVAQNGGAGNQQRTKKSMFTGIGVGLVFGCVVFVLVLLKGFAPGTIVTAVLFSMVGYFNGNNQTLWVMIQGIVQTLLVRLPLSYCMSIQPDASLAKIGLAAPISTVVGIALNIAFYLYWNRKNADS